MRARWLRQAVSDVQELREAAAKANARADRLQTELDAMQSRYLLARAASDKEEVIYLALIELIRVRESEFRSTADSKAWAAVIEEIEIEAVRACDPFPG
jgi:hypothetical protein